jgi:hypothetical protein
MSRRAFHPVKWMHIVRIGDGRLKFIAVIAVMFLLIIFRKLASVFGNLLHDKMEAVYPSLSINDMSVGTVWRHEKVGRIVMVFRCLRERIYLQCGCWATMG